MMHATISEHKSLRLMLLDTQILLDVQERTTLHNISKRKTLNHICSAVYIS